MTPPNPTPADLAPEVRAVLEGTRARPWQAVNSYVSIDDIVFPLFVLTRSRATAIATAVNAYLPHEREIAALRARVGELESRAHCPLCAPDGAPHPSGKPCACGGTRLARDAFDFVNRALVDADLANERIIADLSARLTAAEERAQVAEERLTSEGYRRSCDIPACNCGDQWGHGGHANRRLTEIADTLGEQCNGRTILGVVESLLADLTAAEGRANELLAAEHALSAACVRLRAIIPGAFTEQSLQKEALAAVKEK